MYYSAFWVCFVLAFPFLNVSSVTLEEYGVVSSFEGTVQFAPEIVTLNFLLPIKTHNFQPLPTPDNILRYCNATEDAHLQSICRSQSPPLSQMIDECNNFIPMINQLEKQLTEGTRAEQNSRQKRDLSGFLSAAASVVPIITTAISEFFSYRRHRDLQKALKYLRDGQIANTANINKIQSHLAQYIKVQRETDSLMNHTLHNLASDLLQTQKDLHTVANELASVGRETNKKLLTIPLLSRFTALRNSYGLFCNFKLSNLFQALHMRLSDLEDAARGHLRSTLLSPALIQQALNKAHNNLHKFNPRQRLALSTPSAVYQDSRIILIPGLNAHVLQIPIEVIDQSAPSYFLTSFRSIPVPLNEKLASKIAITAPYLVQSDSHYQILDEKTLGQCHRLNQGRRFICPPHIPLRPLSAPSCLQSLVSLANASAIHNYCKIEVDTFEQWGEHAITNANLLLIFGNADQLQFICSSHPEPLFKDFNSFAVLSRDEVCNCRILGENGFFLHGESCETDKIISNITMVYPKSSLHNVIMADLEQLIKSLDQTPSDIWTMDSITEKLVNLVTDPLETESKYPKSNTHQSLTDLKEHLSQKLLFEDVKGFEKSHLTGNFQNWFQQPSLWPYGLSFFGSLLGIIALVGVCIIAYQQNQYKHLMTAGLFARLPLAKADPASPNMAEDTCILDPRRLAIQIAILTAGHIGILLLIKLSKMFYKWCCYPSIPTLNPDKKLSSQTTYLNLELNAGVECQAVRLARLYGSSESIFFMGTLFPHILNFRRFFFSGQLTLSFGSSSPAHLVVNNITIRLPEIITIPARLTRKIERICRSQHKVRVFLSNTDGFIIPLRDSTNPLFPNVQEDDQFQTYPPPGDQVRLTRPSAPAPQLLNFGTTSM